MRFNTYINNSKCLEWELNASQGALFDLLNQLSSWADDVVIDGEVYYFIAKSKILQELPLFYSKIDTVYRHLKILNNKGLIIYKKDGIRDLVKLTTKGKEWNNSEMNPIKLGNESDKTRIEIRNNSEMNPTYYNTSDNTTSNNNIIVESEISDADIVAKYLHKNIIANNPKFVGKWESWSKDISYAINIDKRTKEELINCINWIYNSKKGEFWIPNILSGKKLRSKYDAMNMQAMGDTNLNRDNFISELFRGEK